MKVIRDEGKSAGSLKRPGIEEIIKLVIAQKIDAVFMVASDRLARNTADHLYLRDLFKKNGVLLRYINQPINDNSALSQTMDTIMASFNEMQRLVTSEKVKKTLYAKAQAGYLPTTAPIGYKNVPNPNATNTLSKRMLVSDEIMAPLITEAFQLYATGNFNGYDLNELMHKKGLKTKLGLKMSPSRFYELLRNRAYLGEVHWGDIHNEKGQHDALIDKDTFEQVQTILAGHNYHACRRRKYSWLLSGFIYCPEHQKRYTAEWHLNKRIAYYHCTHRFGCGKYIEVNELESRIAEKFKDLEFNPLFIEKVIEKAKAIFTTKRQNFEAKRQGLINQKTALEAKRKVAEDKLFEGVIDDDTFKKTRDAINAELSNIEERLSDLEQKQNLNVDISREILQFTRDIYSAYKKASPTLKRQYLAFFWDKFEVKDGVIIKSTPSLLFNELLKLQQVSLKTKNLQKAGDLLANSKVIIRANLLRDQDSNLEPSP